MKNYNYLLGLFFSVAIVFTSSRVLAAPAQSTACIACHGAKGISTTPMWPNLAGQKKEYLAKQLKDFKSGVRKDPMMGPVAKNLSASDIKELAEFYSSMK